MKKVTFHLHYGNKNTIQVDTFPDDTAEKDLEDEAYVRAVDYAVELITDLTGPIAFYTPYEAAIKGDLKYTYEVEEIIQ